jgi:tripartite-type tricarboxylate transporter receptor subunit TctC
MKSMLFVLRAAAALFAAGILSAQAQAPAPQTDFPTRPIRIVVTFPPGGSTDAVVRMIVPRLSDKLGQQVVVDNRPGAGGNIGLTVVAKAPADGYTLGVGAAGALSANVSLYAQMPFDPLKDLKPVSMLAAIPFVIVGHPSLKARTLKELIAQAKADPGKLAIGHGGNGTAMHLSAALFSQMADIKLVEVPYKGSGPAALDVLGGQLPLAVVDLPAALQQIKAGKLIAYAVTSAQRLPTLPDVPSVSEAGPGRHAGGDRRAAQHRDHRGPERPADPGQHAQPRRRAGAGQARSLRGLHPLRDPEVGQGDQAGQHQAGLT